MVPLRFVVYADFEVFTAQAPAINPTSGNESPYTEGIQQHCPCSYGLELICIYDE